MDLSNLDSLTVDEVCELARDPARAQDLTEFLGAEQYKLLKEAVTPSRKMSRGKKGTIVLLPGIMGSQIGKKLRGEWDIIWMNPLAILGGSFSSLKLGSGASKYGARGLLPMFYSLLWARLKYWYGYDIVEFAYDWRVGIQESGDALADFIEEETAGAVYLVAHSMGGLVARAALPRLDRRVQRILQLASPNYGSFSPVVTFRGQNEFINKLLKFDQKNSVTDLISNTVSTFQGLYEMFPVPSRLPKVNLFDSRVWPASPAINPVVLANAKKGVANLPGPDGRFVLIAGNNQETISDMTIDPHGEFQFTTTTSGDGTVPLNLARVDATAQVPTYLANVTHDGIVGDGTVSEAIDEILRTGKTTKLSLDTGSTRSKETTKRFDASRAANPLNGRAFKDLTSAEIRTIQREVLGPLQSAKGASAPGSTAGGNVGSSLINSGFKNVVVGRRRRRLRVVLGLGDITQMPAHAHVLAVFQGVTPSGPAVAFDKLLGGAITDLFQRQMFSGSRGAVYFMPTYKTAIPGDLLTFAGLGVFSDFNSEVVEGVSQQVVQSLLHVRVNELATVIFGGSFADVKQNLRSMLTGFVAGLKEADHNFEFQRIILCERDEKKFADLQRELYDLASSKLFDDTEIEFDSIEIPGRGTTRSEPHLPTAEESSIFLISHLKDVDPTSDNRDKIYEHEISVLPPDSGTSFSQFKIDFSKSDLEAILREAQSGAPDDMDEFGQRLAKLVLPQTLMTNYKDVFAGHSVQLLHDAISSRIPWEVLKFDQTWPALTRGLSRKYQRTQSATLFSRNQQHNNTLRILLVYNPTGDLKGAEAEGNRILSLTSKWNTQMQVTPLHGSEATPEEILSRLKDNNFDVLHYAGHAGYVAESPSQSGLLCAGSRILSGKDLEPLGAQLPPLIILNACESGRVRKVVNADAVTAPASAAEAILNAGIMCFIATYWPVSDAGADIFADKFYEGILSCLQPNGESTTIGQAVLAARTALSAAGENDWGNYMLYGDPGFCLKKPGPAN